MATILVTGASRGIGLEFACQYAEEGDTVIATCRDPETANALKHLSQSHGNVEIQGLDVVDPLRILSLASLISKRGDKIDLLINNAGIMVGEKLGDWTADALSATFDTNVVGPAMIMQSFAKVMEANGKIVNISSGLGSFGLDLGYGSPTTSYAASKAALNMMVRQVAPELKMRGITTVVYSPGWVKTDMGGQEADLTPEESVTVLRESFSKLTLEESGQFFDYSGKPLPW